MCGVGEVLTRCIVSEVGMVGGCIVGVTFGRRGIV